VGDRVVARHKEATHLSGVELESPRALVPEVPCALGLIHREAQLVAHVRLHMARHLHPPSLHAVTTYCWSGEGWSKGS
jgi:hypothetical protein